MKSSNFFKVRPPFGGFSPKEGAADRFSGNLINYGVNNPPPNAASGTFTKSSPYDESEEILGVSNGKGYINFLAIYPASVTTMGLELFIDGEEIFSLSDTVGAALYTAVGTISYNMHSLFDRGIRFNGSFSLKAYSAAATPATFDLDVYYAYTLTI